MTPHPTRFSLWVRKPTEVCTDPQRRCYDGVFASSKVLWTEWGHISNPANREEGLESMATFKEINPTWQFKLLAPLTEET